MIQIAFCDDDQTVLDQLSALLEKYRAQRCVQIQCTAFHSPLDLLAEIEKGTRYDILFLDVIMPAENGITAAKEIRQYDNVVKIIFLTSSAEFAVESYVVGAYFYQLKPIWEDSFFRLTDSVIAECRRADQRSLILRCQLRRWAALLVIALFPTGGTALQDATELVVTLPLLLALVHWIAPSVRALSHSSLKLQLQFGVIPLLSYVFDYFTRIYTDLLSSGNQAAVEFMPFVCSLAYLVFVLQTTQEQKLRSQLEQTQNSLNLQVAQAVREIDALRESQRKASTYRHDLRHHLQYISACIENGRAEAAQEYIHSVCAEIEASKVNVYCENEAANLILSAFATRAQNSGIDFRVHAAIPLVLPLPDSDLCVLLSNALENALHAGQRQREAGKPAVVETTAYQKDGRLFLQIANSCSFPVQFRAEGIPTASQPGHGLGVRSICAIVEQYGGMYSFSQQQDQFVLRISL